jgi:hypothetical protein
MSQEHGKMFVMAIHHVEWNAEFILLTMHQTSVKLVLTVQKTYGSCCSSRSVRPLPSRSLLRARTIATVAFFLGRAPIFFRITPSPRCLNSLFTL